MPAPLPERINASRTITYDVIEIKESLEELSPEDPPTDEQILEYIFDCIATDFGGWHGVIVQDENGYEL